MNKESEKNKLPRPSKKSESDTAKGKENIKAVAKYSGIAFQMGIIIFLGAWGGTRLDSYFEIEKNILTAVLTILSVILAVYLTIKDLMK